MHERLERNVAISAFYSFMPVLLAATTIGLFVFMKGDISDKGRFYINAVLVYGMVSVAIHVLHVFAFYKASHETLGSITTFEGLVSVVFTLLMFIGFALNTEVAFLAFGVSIISGFSFLGSQEAYKATARKLRVAFIYENDHWKAFLAFDPDIAGFGLSWRDALQVLKLKVNEIGYESLQDQGSEPYTPAFTDWIDIS